MFNALSPILNDGLPVAVHALTAFAALALGLFQLIRPKGTASHRALGYCWVALMLLIALSSFMIHGIDQFYGFSLIHLLSIYVIFTLPFGIRAARNGDIEKHRQHMRGLYIWGLLLAGGLTFFPGRRMYEIVFGG